MSPVTPLTVPWVLEQFVKRSRRYGLSTSLPPSNSPLPLPALSLERLVKRLRPYRPRSSHLAHLLHIPHPSACPSLPVTLPISLLPSFPSFLCSAFPPPHSFPLPPPVFSLPHLPVTATSGHHFSSHIGMPVEFALYCFAFGRAVAMTICTPSSCTAA